MAMDKSVRQLNAKLDAIAAALGIDTSDQNWAFTAAPPSGPQGAPAAAAQAGLTPEEAATATVEQRPVGGSRRTQRASK